MKKKALTILLTTIMAAGLITACNSGRSAPDSQNTAEAKPAEEAVLDKETAPAKEAAPAGETANVEETEKTDAQETGEEDDYPFPEDFVQEQSGKLEFKDYDEIISCLKPGQGYAYVRVYGSNEDCLAVAELVFEADNTAGEASLYGMRDGKPVFMGVVTGNGSAYPVRIEDGIIYCGDNHRYESFFLTRDGGGLMQKDYVEDGVNFGSDEFSGFLRETNDFDNTEDFTGGQEALDKLIEEREKKPAITFTMPKGSADS